MLSFPRQFERQLSSAYSAGPHHQILKFKPSCSNHLLPPYYISACYCFCPCLNNKSAFHILLTHSACQHFCMFHWLGNQALSNSCAYLLFSCTRVQCHYITLFEDSSVGCVDNGLHHDSKPFPVSSTVVLSHSLLALLSSFPSTLVHS